MLAPHDSCTRPAASQSAELSQTRHRRRRSRRAIASSWTPPSTWAAWTCSSPPSSFGTCLWGRWGQSCRCSDNEIVAWGCCARFIIIDHIRTIVGVVIIVIVVIVVVIIVAASALLATALLLFRSRGVEVLVVATLIAVAVTASALHVGWSQKRALCRRSMPPRRETSAVRSIVVHLPLTPRLPQRAFVSACRRRHHRRRHRRRHRRPTLRRLQRRLPCPRLAACGLLRTA